MNYLVSPVRGTLSAPGASATFKPQLPKLEAYLTLTGTGSLTGAVQCSLDDGVTWSDISIEGVQLGTVSYAGKAMTIECPTPEQLDVQVRLNATVVTGSVNYSFSA